MILLQTKTRAYFELQPVIPLGLTWQICAVALIVAALVGWSLWLYWKDSVDLSRPAGLLLTSLRLLSIAALVLFVLNPGKRSETKLTKDSRLVLLIDDSLSMGLIDRAASTTGAADVAPAPRIEETLKMLDDPTLESLRQSHAVAAYRFSESDQPELMAELPKLVAAGETVTINDTADEAAEASTRSAWLGWIGLAIALLAVSLIVSSIVRRKTGAETDPGMFGTYRFTAGILILVLSVIVFAVGDLAAPQLTLLDSMGLTEGNEFSTETASESSSDGSADQLKADSSDSPADTKDWLSTLAPRGTSTQIGSAIQAIVNKEKGGPIAGIVLFSDGQSNAGLSVDRATAAANNAGIPIYTVGIGSAEQPKNVLVADLQAPARVFPGDKFQIKGLVKAFGLEGRTARVQLFSVDEQESEAEVLEDEISVRLLADGEPASVEFAISREQEGKRRYEIRAESFEEDLDLQDNSRRCMVEIIRQKTNILLIAGGPTREFRFLRNQLYRDDEIFLNVWLQSAEEGADQESDVLLNSFPQTREELYEIDCIIAFDPDWRKLDVPQTRLLEKWISEQAGGLITVAGPVNTPQWTRQPRGNEQVDIIRRIYPVSFYNQGSAVLKLGRFGGTTPFPLSFSRAGRSADFLWIGDSAGISQETWAQFEGVFGYYAVNDPKPGADVLANFGDPETAIDDTFPIYLASQFYGAGRVFFQASGEMWRVRRLDVEYFQQYYTKLIRWASQGRLNRDSTRGVLLTDRERCWMGDIVAVQAILKDAQDNPLDYPQVEATIRTPNGVNETITLRSNPAAASPGSFSGSFVAGSDGEFRVSLAVPESPDLDILTALVTASIPDLEKEKPQRNDAVLERIAQSTGGTYVFQGDFQEDLQAVSPVNPLSALQTIPPQDQETIIAGTFDRFFKRRLMMWSLAVMTLCFSLEWILRRLQKLA